MTKDNPTGNRAVPLGDPDHPMTRPAPKPEPKVEPKPAATKKEKE